MVLVYFAQSFSAGLYLRILRSRRTRKPDSVFSTVLVLSRRETHRRRSALVVPWVLDMFRFRQKALLEALSRPIEHCP